MKRNSSKSKNVNFNNTIPIFRIKVMDINKQDTEILTIFEAIKDTTINEYTIAYADKNYFKNSDIWETK